MGENLRDRLETDRSFTDWRSLRWHHEREALFLVANTIDLVDAGLAVARDNAAKISAWIEAGHLRKPTASESEEWEQATDVCFDYLIVQPFVLATVRADQPGSPDDGARLGQVSSSEDQ